MNKGNYIILASSVVVFISVVVIALLILLPQASTLLEASASKYEAIIKNDFTFKQTKDITREALVKEYGITSAQMDKFKKNNQYISGNSDPFTPKSEEETENTTTNNKNNSSNSNTSVSKDTVDKITNSNGGVPNPPSTNK